MPIFHHFDVLSSTIDEAHSHVLQGAEEGTVIVAYRQTKGRGRRGRTWEDLFGNLYMTYITYLNCPLSEALQLSFVACVAVGETLRPLLPPCNSLTYKWPNDVLLNGKKVGGLLLEVLSLSEKKQNACLVSCGLNVITQPSQVAYPTTSFHKENIYLSLEEVRHGIAASLEKYIAFWKKEGFSPIYDLWMKNAAGLEEKIFFELSGQRQEGIFKGIDVEGALLLRTSQGLKKFTAGEILAGEQHVASH